VPFPFSPAASLTLRCASTLSCGSPPGQHSVRGHHLLHTHLSTLLTLVLSLRCASTLSCGSPPVAYTRRSFETRSSLVVPRG
jgi:hypothetical protein